MNATEIAEHLLADLNAYGEHVKNMLVECVKEDYRNAGLNPDDSSDSIRQVVELSLKADCDLFMFGSAKKSLATYLERSLYHRVTWEAHFSGVDGDDFDVIDSMALKINSLVKSAKSEP